MERNCNSRVRKAARLSIRQALGVGLALTAASTVLGAAGIFGYQLYRSGQSAERLRVAGMAEVYAAQVAGLPGTEESQEFVEKWNWHPGSRLLAVLDRDGCPVVVRGDRAILERRATAEYLYQVMHPRAESELLPGDRELFLPDVAVAAVPIVPPGAVRPTGILVYAARAAGVCAPAAEWAAGGIWKYIAAVLGVAGAGMVMGLCLLRYSLLEPMRRLLQVGRGDGRAGLLPAEPPDEIGALAGMLEGLRGEMEEWRARALRLEESMERRVETETHNVTLKLKQVERTAWVDPLTQLGNRRLLDAKLAQLFAQSRESGEDLAVVMIDVDEFKRLNDTMGHKAGDEVVGFIGELLRQCVRETDLAIRYGGDEFLLVLPGATAATAGATAERIVRLFGQQSRLLPVEPKPSMSAGVASLKEHRPGTPTALLQMADQALYQAKRRGKSQVCVCSAKPGRTVAGGRCPELARWC